MYGVEDADRGAAGADAAELAPDVLELRVHPFLDLPKEAFQIADVHTESLPAVENPAIMSNRRQVSTPNCAIPNCQATPNSQLPSDSQLPRPESTPNSQTQVNSQCRLGVGSWELGVGSWKSLGSWALRSWALSSCDSRPDGLPGDDAAEVAGGPQVEDDDRQLVVHAERDRSGVHDLEPLLEHLEVGDRVELGRVRIDQW